VRAHQSGGNRLLPAGSFNTNMLYPPPDPAEPAGYPAAWWLSHFAGPLGFSVDFRTWSTAHIAAGRRYVDAFKRWRHLLAADFYPLFPPPRTLADWDGWQFDDPERGEGLIVVFRERSAARRRTIALRGAAGGASFTPLLPLDGAALAPGRAGRTARVTLDAGGVGAWSYRRA
jgi:hypothetical protein